MEMIVKAIENDETYPNYASDFINPELEYKQAMISPFWRSPTVYPGEVFLAPDPGPYYSNRGYGGFYTGRYSGGFVRDSGGLHKSIGGNKFQPTRRVPTENYNLNTDLGGADSLSYIYVRAGHEQNQPIRRQPTRHVGNY